MICLLQFYVRFVLFFVTFFVRFVLFFVRFVLFFVRFVTFFVRFVLFFVRFWFFEFRTKRTVTPPLVKYRNFYSKIISTYSQISIGTFWLRPLLLKTIHYNLSLYTSMLRCYQRVSTVKCHIHTGRSYLSIQTFASRDVC